MIAQLSRLIVTMTLIGTAGATADSVSMGGVGSARAGTWTPEVSLSGPSWYQRAADSAVSADGDMAVVWDVHGKIKVARRPAGGAWGPVTTVAVKATTPRLDYDGGGRLLLVWAKNPARVPKRVEARAYTPGSGWDTPRVLARRTAGRASVIDLDVNQGGEAVLSWQWNARGLVARGTVTGAFSTGLRINDVDPRALDVALGDGGLAAVLTQRAIRGEEDEADLVLKVARQPRGEHWGAFRVLRSLGDVAPPWPGTGGLAVDAAGVTTVAWLAPTATPSWSVRVARAGPGGGWSKVALLARTNANWEFPVRVAGNPRGDVLVTYPGRSQRSLRVVRRPSGGPWSGPVNVSGALGYLCDWDVALDPSGRALAVWSRSRGPGDWGRGLDVALMTRTGHWRAPTRLSSARTLDGHARLAAMDNGDALAVWSQKAGSSTFAITARTRS